MTRRWRSTWALAVPLAFVMFSFPWGVKGSDLEHRDGPYKRQTELLKDRARLSLERPATAAQ